MSTAKLAVDHTSALTGSTTLSIPPPTVVAEEPSKASSTSIGDEIAPKHPLHPGRILKLVLDPLPPWARWVLGSLVVASLPFAIKLLKIEEKVEKAVETVAEMAEEAAEAAKNTVAGIAESLPEGSLKRLALEVEDVAEGVIIGSEMTKSFICKVDEVKEEIEEVAEPLAAEAGENVPDGKTAKK